MSLLQDNYDAQIAHLRNLEPYVPICSPRNTDVKACIVFTYQQYSCYFQLDCQLVVNCIFINSENRVCPADDFICGLRSKVAADCASSEQENGKLCEFVSDSRTDWTADKSTINCCSFAKLRLLTIDACLAGCVTEEISQSVTFAKNFLAFANYLGVRCRHGSLVGQGLSDVKWSDRIGSLVVKRMMLDDAMNWLSTLGGAYSALGDYFVHHAVHAGVISMRQLRIALDMGSPPVVIRCYLYTSLSLMQTGQLRKAKHLIRQKYAEARQLPVLDVPLLRMCRGLWSRLQYLRTRRRLKHLEPRNGLGTESAVGCI